MADGPQAQPICPASSMVSAEPEGEARTKCELYSSRTCALCIGVVCGALPAVGNELRESGIREVRGLMVGVTCNSSQPLLFTSLIRD